MKKITSVVAAAGFLLVLNIQHPPFADKAITTNAQTVAALRGDTYTVDAAGSTVGWTGTKPSGKHTGTINIVKGQITADGGVLTAGNFTIDINTIACTDLQGKGKDGLEGHLKSPDFFDAAANPTAVFEITAVTPVTTEKSELEGATHTIAGNLTLKGVTKNISFPAAVAVTGKALSARADFNIDRTLWGMTYGADGKVAKEINLKLDIKATK